MVLESDHDVATILENARKCCAFVEVSAAVLLVGYKKELKKPTLGMERIAAVARAEGSRRLVELFDASNGTEYPLSCGGVAL
jgi:hypothetical protein